MSVKQKIYFKITIIIFVILVSVGVIFDVKELGVYALLVLLTNYLAM